MGSYTDKGLRNNDAAYCLTVQLSETLKCFLDNRKLAGTEVNTVELS